MESDAGSIFNRRKFLQGSAAALVASHLPLAPAEQPAASSISHDGDALAIPDSGWRLWPDQQAEWKNDSIFLPEDVHLDTLPVNTPTGGWQVLDATLGIPVTLPTTVEQYFWALQGLRPYHDEYRFETTDDEVKNGAYYGVSWWWRPLDIPAAFKGKRIVLRIRGARHRAEVYLNQKLVGYSILEELPFECDVTEAAHPGETNQLAIRITNPGGRLDWVDGNRLTWGNATFQKSHGFGGLDRALTLSAHGPARIRDSWVLNTPQARRVTVHAEIENTGAAVSNGRLRFAIVDPATNRELAHSEIAAPLDANQTAAFQSELTCPTAHLWDLDTPHLYRMTARWTSAATHATRSVDFGFRWFAPDGIGTNAFFRLNGRRVRIYTAISWGYWALNGLWPTPELAEKEVAVAKHFNLNCLNFHRNLAKEEVLAVQDRRGLLRALEPGGGYQAVGRADAPPDFANRYMEAKIIGMIRAYRSHPSVIEYILQNEARPDLNNPNLARILRGMHAEDPSRTIVANDGFASRAAQAWIEPYSDHLRTSAEGGAGGWWDEHQGPPSDVWQDAHYVNVNDFLYHSTNKTEIVEWGEMKGAASIDDHEQLVRQIMTHGGKSYDLADHQELLAVYEEFLDTWGFRKAFPRASDLFQSIGRRAYESWGQFLENIRICDANDYSTISGWESTAMENHSGLVDNFRDYKSNPDPIRLSLLSVRPVAKQKALVAALGGQIDFDLYLLNDSNRPVHGKLAFAMTDPAGVSHTVDTYDAPEFVPDQLSYLVQRSAFSPKLDREGVWTTHFSLAGNPASAHTRQIWVVDPTPHRFENLRIATHGLADEITAQLSAIPGLVFLPFTPGRKYDLIIASPATRQPTDTVSTDDVGADKRSLSIPPTLLPDEIVAAFTSGTPLFTVCTNDGQATGAGAQLASAAGFQFAGMVGSSRASWMGTWFFVRKHPVYDGLPVDRAMSIEYQVKGSDSNGLIVSGDGLEIIAAYSRDHDRKIGAGTFAFSGQGRRLLFHRITGMHATLHRRLLSNAIQYLTANNA
ncbi:MAG TPA: glycoside hydrolase [Terracidiphilus sp.]|nr:glycoside hydrolase [Terracidiphilus sp.]